MKDFPKKIYLSIDRSSDDVLIMAETYERPFLGKNIEYIRSDIVKNKDAIKQRALSALEEIEYCITDILSYASISGVTELSRWKFKDQCSILRSALMEKDE